MRKIAAIMAFVIAIVFVAGAALAMPKEITFKAGAMGDVHFPMMDHVNEFHLKCTDCHTKIFPMKGPENGGVKFSMADIRAGKYCGECHNGKTAFAPAGNCNKCHHH
ncbi:MAG: cytochrome c3 family protein [Nitrospiraceae bacterium]|nr:cytochrome c3 family protein [Nitrospiraceae bacterium]